MDFGFDNRSFGSNLKYFPNILPPSACNLSVALARVTLKPPHRAAGCCYARTNMDDPKRDSTSAAKQSDPAIVTADPDLHSSLSTPVILNPSPIDVDATETDINSSKPDSLSDDVQYRAEDSGDGEGDGEGEESGDDEVDADIDDIGAAAVDDVEEVITVEDSDALNTQNKTNDDKKRDETIDLTFSPVPPPGKGQDHSSVGIAEQTAQETETVEDSNRNGDMHDEAGNNDELEILHPQSEEQPDQEPKSQVQDEELTPVPSSTEVEPAENLSTTPVDDEHEEVHVESHGSSQDEGSENNEFLKESPPSPEPDESEHPTPGEEEKSSSPAQLTLTTKGEENIDSQPSTTEEEENVDPHPSDESQLKGTEQNDQLSNDAQAVIPEPSQVNVDIEMHSELENLVSSDDAEEETDNVRPKPFAPLESLSSTSAVPIEAMEPNESEQASDSDIIISDPGERTVAVEPTESEKSPKPNQDLSVDAPDDNGKQPADNFKTNEPSEASETPANDDVNTTNIADDDAIPAENDENEGDGNENVKESDVMHPDEEIPSNGDDENQLKVSHEPVSTPVDIDADTADAENVQPSSATSPIASEDNRSESIEKKNVSVEINQTSTPSESGEATTTDAAVDDVAEEESIEPDSEMEATTEESALLATESEETDSTQDADMKPAMDEVASEKIGSKLAEEANEKESSVESKSLPTTVPSDSEKETGPIPSDSEKETGVIPSDTEKETGLIPSDSEKETGTSTATEPPAIDGSQDNTKATSESDGEELDIEMDAEEREILESSDGDGDLKSSSTAAVDISNSDVEEIAKLEPKPEDAADVDMEDVAEEEEETVKTPDELDTRKVHSDVVSSDEKLASTSETESAKPDEALAKSTLQTNPSQTLSSISPENNEGLTSVKNDENIIPSGNEMAASKEGTSVSSDAKTDGSGAPAIKGVLSKAGSVDAKKPAVKVQKRVTFSDKAEEFMLPPEPVSSQPATSGLTGGSFNSTIPSTSLSVASPAEQSRQAIASAKNTKDQIVTDSKTSEGHRIVEVINVTCSVKTQKTSTPKKRSSSFRVRLFIHNGTAEFELLNGNSPDSGLWTVLNPNQGGPITVRKVRKPPYVMSVVVFDNVNGKMVENTRLYIHLQRSSYEKLFPLCEYYLMKLPSTRPRPPNSGPYRSAITSFSMEGDAPQNSNSEGAAKDKPNSRRNEHSRIGHHSSINPGSAHSTTPKTSGTKRHAEGGFTKSPTEQQANMKKPKMDSATLEEKKRMNAQILSDKKKELLAKMGKGPSVTPSSVQMSKDSATHPKHASSSLPDRPSTSTSSKISSANPSATGPRSNTNANPRWGTPRPSAIGGGIASSGGSGSFGSAGPRPPSFKPTPRGMVSSVFGKGGSDGNKQRRSGSGILKTIKMKNPPGGNDVNEVLKDEVVSNPPSAISLADMEEKTTKETEKRLKKLKSEWDETAKKKSEATKNMMIENFDSDLRKIVQWSISKIFQKHRIPISDLTTTTGDTTTPTSHPNEALLRIADPLSVDHFFARLQTFKPRTWVEFATRSNIDPVECAMRGWYNPSCDKLKSTEGAEITIDRDALLNVDKRETELNRVTQLIRGAGHQLLSTWIGQCCPDEFRKVKDSGKLLSKEQFLQMSNSMGTTA